VGVLKANREESNFLGDKGQKGGRGTCEGIGERGKGMKRRGLDRKNPKGGRVGLTVGGSERRSDL